MPLHGLKASQLLHTRGAPLVADPHAEGTLHQHASQLADVALRMVGRSPSLRVFSVTHKHQLMIPNLVSCDGNLMHGVIDRF